MSYAKLVRIVYFEHMKVLVLHFVLFPFVVFVYLLLFCFCILVFTFSRMFSIGTLLMKKPSLQRYLHILIYGKVHTQSGKDTQLKMLKTLSSKLLSCKLFRITMRTNTFTCQIHNIYIYQRLLVSSFFCRLLFNIESKCFFQHFL